jgi:hypothetical protein
LGACGHLNRRGPVKAPLKSTHVTAVDDGRRPVDAPRSVQALQEHAVQPREDASRLPLLQTSMRGAGDAEFARSSTVPGSPRSGGGSAPPAPRSKDI